MRKTDRDRIDVLSTAEGYLRTRTDRRRKTDRDRIDVLSMQRITSGRGQRQNEKDRQRQN